MDESHFLTHEDLILEEKCRVCSGAGRRTKDFHEISCYYCNGSGYELTMLGERVLALLKNNLQIIQGKSDPVDARPG